MTGETASPESNGGPKLAQPPPPGILVPVPTFFARKTAATYDPVTLPLDLEAQTGHAVYLAQAGIVGLVLLGSTGEAVYLRETERFSKIPTYPVLSLLFFTRNAWKSRHLSANLWILFVSKRDHLRC